MKMIKQLKRWIYKILVFVKIRDPKEETVQVWTDWLTKQRSPTFTDEEGTTYKRLYLNDLLDPYIDELMEQYKKKGIFNWNDIPFSIKKHLYTSMAFHSDGAHTFRDALVGVFSDTNWNFDTFHCEPFDLAIDAYFKETCEPSCEGVVIVINQQMFDDLMRWIPKWFEGNYTCDGLNV